MKMNKKKSLLSRVFGGDSASADAELLLCLHNLSSISEGNDRKVDAEIASFKKMIKIGSPIVDLQHQITMISSALKQMAKLPENNKFVKLFKQMPTKILIDEFLLHPLSVAVKVRLKNYRNSLSATTLATSSIPDLISMLEAESIAQKEPVNDPVPEPNLSTVTTPLLQLFSQIELTNEEKSELTKMRLRSQEMHNFEELCVFIEDLSQIILELIANSACQFEAFLIQLKHRLDKVNNFITANRETSQALSQCSETFSRNLSKEVVHLQSSLGSTTDIAQLEAAISTRLETIADGITNFDTERKSLELIAADKIEKLEHELSQTRKETLLLKDNLHQQRHRALTDPLTLLPNRQAYNERIELEYSRWQRYQQPLSLIVGDIDLFKKINDTYGHIVGDTALKEIARLLQQGLRETDFVARYGGEEFVLLMPETALTDATKAINKIRKTIQYHQIHDGSVSFKITMSFGVATFDDDDTVKTVLDRADKAMYRAKSKGRNQICIQR